MIIYAAVNNESDRKTLQFELNLLCEWCDKWGLTINFNKCKLLGLHFGNIVKYIFHINSALLILLTLNVKKFLEC